MKSNVKNIVNIVGVIFLVTVLSSCIGNDGESKKDITLSDNNIIENTILKDENSKKTVENAGVLDDYSEEALKNATGDIVLFFHASWCGTCRASKDDIMTKGVPEGLTILVADFDTEIELKSKYGVTVQTTFVQVKNNGEMIKKWKGGKLDEIIKNVDKGGIVKNMDNDSDIVLESKFGIYTDYSEDLLANAEGNVVLFFHATWCPSCRSADSSLKSETIPEGLTILKLDYDDNIDLRKKYGVTGQHTFVQVDNNGNKLSKWVGGRSVSDIQENLK